MLRNLLFPIVVDGVVSDAITFDDVVAVGLVVVDADFLVDISGITSSFPFPSPWDVLIVGSNEAGEEAVDDEAAE